MIQAGKENIAIAFRTFGIFLIFLYTVQCTQTHDAKFEIKKSAHIVLIGNNLCSRMMNFGHFETEMHLRFPDSLLYIRNMCDGGNTPGFRPHSRAYLLGHFRVLKNSRRNWQTIQTAKVTLKRRINGLLVFRLISSLLVLDIMNRSREKRGLKIIKLNSMPLSNIH